MKYILMTLCVLHSLKSDAQKATQNAKVIAASQPQQNAAGVYDAPEVKAYFPFGQDSLDHFIKRNFHFRTVDNAAAGKAVVVFIVETDGSIANAEIISTSGDKDFDKEAVRVVKTIRGWKPATNKGKVVRSTAMLTVVFNVK